MFDIKYKVVDEVKLGKDGKIGTHLRLVENQKGKKVIQSWSSLSQQWNVMYRENVEDTWKSWKNLEKTTKYG